MQYKSIWLVFGTTKIILFTFFSLCVNVYPILNRGNTAKKKKKNRLNCFYLTFWHSHILPALFTFSLLMRKNGWKGKGAMDCPHCPFSSVSGYSAQVIGYRDVPWVRKDMLEFLGHLYFLNYLLGHTKKVLVLKENVASQIYYQPAHSVIDVTHLHLTLSLDEFHTSWIQ